MSILSDGGPLTWAVLAWAFALYAGIFNEIARRRGRYAAALAGGVVGQVALGVFGTAAGFISASSIPPDRLPLVIGVAVIPTAVATLLAAPAAVLVGVVATRD